MEIRHWPKRNVTKNAICLHPYRTKILYEGSVALRIFHFMEIFALFFSVKQNLLMTAAKRGVGIHQRHTFSRQRKNKEKHNCRFDLNVHQRNLKLVQQIYCRTCNTYLTYIYAYCR